MSIVRLQDKVADMSESVVKTISPLPDVSCDMKVLRFSVSQHRRRIRMKKSRNRGTQSHQEKRNGTDGSDMEYEPNPDVVPFQPANFMSSTILKKVPIPKRHLDTFGGYEYNFIGRRGVMLHTDRYQVDFIKSIDGMTQRERLQAGFEYMEAMRGTRRKREMVPHRANLDLILGGKQIEFEERFDIAREIQKLKSIAMPKNAKDLFHGRGIILPNNHMSIHPRLTLTNDLEDELFSGPATFPRRPVNLDSSTHHNLQPSQSLQGLPALDRSSTTLQAKGGFKKSKSSLQRNPLPGIRTGSDTTTGFHPGYRGRLHRDVTSLSRSQTQVPPPTRDTSYDPASLLARGTTGAHPIPPPKKKPLDLHLPTDKADSKEEARTTTTPRTAMVSKPGTAEAPATGGKGAEPEAAQNKRSPAQTPASNIPPASSEAKTRPITQGSPTSNTPHPLKGTDLMHSVPQHEQETLRETFQRLDTDADGHIKYQQLKSHLPKHFSREQERFTEEVYNISNSITFFGIEEFMIMDKLSKTVESLTDKAAEAFSQLDFDALPDELLKYVGKFDEADRGNRGKIGMEDLRNILSNTVSPQLSTDENMWGEIQNLISTESSTVSKIEFIAHIPLYLSLQKDPLS